MALSLGHVRRSLVPFSRGISSLIRDGVYIDGEWPKAASNAQMDVTNPANGKVIATVPNCGVEDAKRAVLAAKKAFKSWGFDTTARERHDLLLKWYRLVMEHQDELAKIMTCEQGKPLAESKGEIAYGAGFLEWFAEEARRVDGEIVPPAVKGRQILIYREPIGVAAMITPWNFPSSMITRKAGAALAAGCTCVVRAAEDTPLSALALADLAHKAGIPKGVFNVISSDRQNADPIGRYFCESKDIGALSFTGSTPVGKLLLKQSADTVKRVSLELGGNAPFVVFDSADVDAAVTGAMASKFRNSGQTCVCANRMLVQKGIHDEFVTKLKVATEKLVVGDGSEQGTTQGPLINHKAIDKVERLVKDAVGRKAELVTGGQRHNKGGGFFTPTILTNVNKDMDIFREEIFGPVAAICKFDSENDAVEMCNQVLVGLAGYFYSRDLSQIFRVARRMEVGMVGVNEGIISAPEAAFGGVKESGIGREGSHFGIDEYTNVKYVCLGGL